MAARWSPASMRLAARVDRDSVTVHDDSDAVESSVGEVGSRDRVVQRPTIGDREVAFLVDLGKQYPSAGIVSLDVAVLDQAVRADACFVRVVEAVA